MIKIDSTVEVPGAVSVETEGLADALAAAATPDLEISPPAPDIGFVHRPLGDAEVYLVSQHRADGSYVQHRPADEQTEL